MSVQVFQRTFSLEQGAKRGRREKESLKVSGTERAEVQSSLAAC